MRRPRRSLSDDSGFTLLEVMLATLLMTVILAALGTVTAQWLPNWNRGIARVQQAERLATGLDRIVADLSVAEQMTVNGDARAPLFDGAELSVTFLRTALGPSTRPGLEFIRLVEKADAQGLALVRERAARQRVTVALTVADPVGEVWADEIKLKQVVVNLLTNAVKFTPVGGEIDVDARVVGDEAVVSVRDTGVGIAAADQGRIFEAFQRGDRRASVEGTGLGLTLSKRFVELHGGRMWVQSALGAGSTFAFAIPVGQR